MSTKNLSVWFKKHPFSVICGGLSLLLVAAYFFRQGSVPETQTLLADRAAESSRLQANISNSAMLKDQVAALEDANNKVSQRLVRPADVAKNQQYFYKIEADTGVKLMDLRAGGTTTAPGKPAAGPKKLYSSVPYSCTVQGTYSQLLTFLRKLEQGEHFQRILTATLSTGGSRGGGEEDAPDPTLTLVLTLELLGQS